MKKNIGDKSTNVRVNSPVEMLVSSLLNMLWWAARPLSRYILYKLFFTARRYEPNSLESQLLEQAKSTSIIVNGHKIRSWKWGKGLEY